MGFVDGEKSQDFDGIYSMHLLPDFYSNSLKFVIYDLQFLIHRMDWYKKSFTLKKS